MPLKLNISTSRKIGAPNYGSRGATVGLEMELEANLISQPQQLQDRIAHLFRLANESVDRELNGQSSQDANGRSVNGAAAGHGPTVRRATRRQISAICAIANERQLDLAVELQGRFGHDRPGDLSIIEASDIIDMLKRKVQEGPTGQPAQPPSDSESAEPGQP
jgi:hypothetical protein